MDRMKAEFLQRRRLRLGAGLVMAFVLLSLPAVAAGSSPPVSRTGSSPALSAMNRQIASAADDVS